jgi:hypothetical protein
MVGVAAAEEGRGFLGAVAGTSAARGDGCRGGQEAVEVAGEVEGRWSHRVGTESSRVDAKLWVDGRD